MDTELVLPTYNAYPYFSLKNLGKKYALHMAKYGNFVNMDRFGNIFSYLPFLIAVK